METSVFEVLQVLKTGTPVDDILGGGIGLGKLSVIGGAHEDVSNVLAHAVLRLSEQCAVLYVPIREREEDAIARLIRAEMGPRCRKILRNNRLRRTAQRCGSSSAAWASLSKIT